VIPIISYLLFKSVLAPRSVPVSNGRLISPFPSLFEIPTCFCQGFVLFFSSVPPPPPPPPPPTPSSERACCGVTPFLPPRPAEVPSPDPPRARPSLAISPPLSFLLRGHGYLIHGSSLQQPSPANHSVSSSALRFFPDDLETQLAGLFLLRTELHSPTPLTSP